MLASWKKSYDNPRQCIQNQSYHFADKALSSQSYSFSSSHIRMWELDRKKKLNSEELMPLNYSAGKDSWESLEQQGYQISHSSRKSTLNTHWKNWYWSWSSSTLATWWEEPTAWTELWWWARLKAKGEEGDRGWDGWMASPTQWTWVWVNSGRPGMLQSIMSQRVIHD